MLPLTHHGANYIPMKTIFILCVSLFTSISLYSQTLIIYGEKATHVEVNAANDLREDILIAYPNEKVDLQRAARKIPTLYKNVIIIGTQESNKLLNGYSQSEQSKLLADELHPETFIIEGSGVSKNKTYIIGADDRGTYYGVYEFSERVLGTDPMVYWTGRKPVIKSELRIPEISYRASKPTFPLRGYFDNDNDMLANWKGRKLIVELDIWKEMINSLSRLRYNYIDIHDLLGRPEYRLRKFYTDLTDYKSDLELIEQVIDYAHSKGMLVQIPMYLGWDFYHMDDDKICLSEHYDHWMEIFEYYLTKTPIKKADLFLQRPRHPYYDWPYKCEAEEKTGVSSGELMEKMFHGLYDLIQEYRPGATLVCDLWSEGREMWASGEFAPRNEIQMLWADNYGGDFKEWPSDKQGYDFGLYIHAGIWLNHVIQDPLVHQLSEAINEGVRRGMTNNILVNGQDFKHFILNLEVSAKVAWDAEGFDPAKFYTDWTVSLFW